MKKLGAVLAVFLTVSVIATTFGAAPATAGNTVLCKVDAIICENKDQLTHIRLLDANTSILTSLEVTILCHTRFLGTILALGAPQVIHGSFTYSECLSEPEWLQGCEAVELSAGGLLRVLREEEEKGSVTGEGFEVLVGCEGSTPHCVYNWLGLKATILGALKGSEGKISWSEQALNKVKGFFCPSTTKLDLNFESFEELVWASKPFYVKS